MVIIYGSLPHKHFAWRIKWGRQTVYSIILELALTRTNQKQSRNKAMIPLIVSDLLPTITIHNLTLASIQSILLISPIFNR